MPNVCSVPYYKGNYRNGPNVTVFCFPKDPQDLGKWVRAIKRDFQPSPHRRVCELHFSSEDLIQDTTYCDEETGKTLTVPLQRKKLRKHAIPSQMPNCSVCMSRKVAVWESPETRRKKKQDEQLVEPVKPIRACEGQNYTERCFESFEELKSKFHFVDELTDWNGFINPTCIVCCKIDLDPQPDIKIAVVVDQQLQVDLFYHKSVVHKRGKDLGFPLLVNNANILSDILRKVVIGEERGSEDKCRIRNLLFIMQETEILLHLKFLAL